MVYSCDVSMEIERRIGLWHGGCIWENIPKHGAQFPRGGQTMNFISISISALLALTAPWTASAAEANRHRSWARN